MNVPYTKGQDVYYTCSQPKCSTKVGRENWIDSPAEDTEDEVHDEERAEDDHRDEEGDRHVGVPHGVQDLHAVPAEREKLRGEKRQERWERGEQY